MALALASTTAPASPTDDARLLRAAAKGDAQAVAAALASGANPRIRDENDQPALLVGIIRGNPEVVSKLLDAMPDALDESLVFADGKGTPIEAAAWFRHDELFARLIECGADWKAHDYGAMGAAVASDSPQIVKRLLDLGMDPDHLFANGARPLTLAAYMGQQEITQLLLDHKARVNARDAGGDTALRLATANNHPGIVALLLDHGANALLSNSSGANALSAIADIKDLEGRRAMQALYDQRGIKSVNSAP